MQKVIRIRMDNYPLEPLDERRLIHDMDKFDKMLIIDTKYELDMRYNENKPRSMEYYQMSDLVYMDEIVFLIGVIIEDAQIDLLEPIAELCEKYQIQLDGSCIGRSLKRVWGVVDNQLMLNAIYIMLRFSVFREIIFEMDVK